MTFKPEGVVKINRGLKMEHCVVAIQMVTTPNLSTNLATAGELIAAASTQGAKLVLLPEVLLCFRGGQYGSMEG